MICFVTFKSCLNGLPLGVPYVQNQALVELVIEIIQCQLHCNTLFFTNTRTIIYNCTYNANNFVISCCIRASINCCLVSKYENQDQDRAQRRKLVHDVQRSKQLELLISPTPLYICMNAFKFFIQSMSSPRLFGKSATVKIRFQVICAVLFKEQF